jgi:hypothetical protein
MKYPKAQITQGAAVPADDFTVAAAVAPGPTSDPNF